MKEKTSRIVSFLYEVGVLRKILRAHYQTLLTNDETDNIASHSYRTAMIGWQLALSEGADLNKVIQMCLIHDLPEARSGDQNWVHKRYVKVYENEIIADQFSGLPNKEDLIEIANEYSERQTLEAKVAKDADLLDQVLLLREYEWNGNKEAEKWLDGAEQGKRLSTNTAKEWVKEIRIQNPSQWWQNVWTPNNR